MNMDSGDDLRRARIAAAATLLWLCAAVLLTGLATAALLFAPYEVESAAYQMVLCVAGGAFGASVASLAALTRRIARGWELPDGRLLPAADGEGVRFGARQVPGFVAKPVLGAATGLLLYLVLWSTLPLILQGSEEMAFNSLGLLMLATASGLVLHGALDRPLRHRAARRDAAMPSPVQSATQPVVPPVSPATERAPVSAAPAPSAQAPSQSTKAPAADCPQPSS
jgi:hypothetical protein